MNAIGTIKFSNGLTISQIFKVINYDGYCYLIFQTIDDGQRLALRLAPEEVSDTGSLDLWGKQLLSVGSIDATAERARVLPSEV